MEIMKKFAQKAAANETHDAITLAFFGDSVTQGCFELLERTDGGFDNCHDRQHVYHTYLAQIFSVLYPTVPVNIINAGIAGTSAEFGLTRVERDVIAHKPDLTVVCFGLNDCGKEQQGLETYISALGKIFDRLEEAGSEIIFMTPNMMATQVSPRLTFPLFQTIAKTVAERQNGGILDMYLDAAKALCRERNIAVCDCYAKWKQLHENGVDVTSLLSNRINHPVREMHWLFAAALAETMMR